MNLLIPVDCLDEKTAKLSSLQDKKGWVFVKLDSGSILSIDAYAKKDDIKDMIDYIVIKDKNEDVDEFLDEDIGVLVAPFQKSIDDIVEAFIFTELYELGS